MRIVIDGQALQSSSRLRGIGRYSEALIDAMIDLGSGHEFVLALNGMFPDTIDPIRDAFGKGDKRVSVRVWDAPGPTYALDPDNAWRQRAAELVRETFLLSLSPDCILVTTLFEGSFENVVTSVGEIASPVPTAAIFYDLIPLIFKKQYLYDDNIKKWYNGKVEYLKQFEHLLSISEATLRDGVKELGLLEENITNISGAAGGGFSPKEVGEATEQDIRSRYGLNRPFVMYTGGDDPRKNLAGMVSAFAQLPTDVRQQHQLALVCTISDARIWELEAVAASFGMAPDELVITGRIPDADLIDLYRLSKLFAFPSLYEGFGLPALEAMSCGRAVIGAKNSGIAEVVGQEQALFDTDSETAFRDKMLTALSNDAFRQELEVSGLKRSRQFSWRNSAAKALEALEAVVHSKTKAPRSLLPSKARPRLAFLSPLPPQRSGISYHSSAILPTLVQFYNIEVIVTDLAVDDDWIKQNCPIRSVEWFRDNADSYDRVVYQFGNSPFHDHMFDLLELIPGVVVLHDFYLSSALANREKTVPGCVDWSESLYISHGYDAVLERKNAADFTATVSKYPCNHRVLDQAIHVIVHSEHARELSAHWYGEQDMSRWTMIPLARAQVPSTRRQEARRRLGIPEGAFVVCNPGNVAPTKLNHRLLDAWRASSLAKEEGSLLIFAGGVGDVEYSKALENSVSESGLNQKVWVTGWLDTLDFKDYLTAADIGVQLRTQSRGETSASALDCLNHGLPTIVNAHGALAEIPEECVTMLPDQFDDKELSYALQMLANDPDQCRRLVSAATDRISDVHTPEQYGRLCHEAIERAYESPGAAVAELPMRLGQIEPGPKEKDREYAALASAVSRSLGANLGPKQLLVDISQLVIQDQKAGIHRVTRSLLNALFESPPTGYRIEPVYRPANTNQADYLYAREYISKYLGCPQSGLNDAPIDFVDGDVFLLLDLDHWIVTCKPLFKKMRTQGVKIWAIVYDLLPIEMPQHFIPDLRDLHVGWLDLVTGFDGNLCISEDVANKLRDWLATVKPEAVKHLEVDWFHLGSDIERSSPTSGLPAGHPSLLAAMEEHPTFLMVGTVEPRKGHKQTLDAFEILWRGNADINLLIIGKQGWLVDDLAQRLARHPENGQRLFWLEDASDEFLEVAYKRSAALLVASEGEGFGLPIIEAARRETPIIARDLPVFREVAKDCAFYFDGLTAHDLASAIEDWLALAQHGKTPRSSSIPLHTWAASAQKISNRITGNP